MTALLEVKGLKKYFPQRSGLFNQKTSYFKAVDDVSFTVPKGKTLGLVGESGSGKTTIGKCAIRLLEPTEGKILFDGEDISHLPLTQSQLAVSGHAIEARVYAEDPRKDFLPATGDLRVYRPPTPSAHVRIDTGVREGDRIDVFYDPMIAKLIVWDTDRDAALRRLRIALAEYRVAGVTTNLPFLAALAAHPKIRAGGVDTGFLAAHRDELIPTTEPASATVLALAALYQMLTSTQQARKLAAASGDPYSPWHLTTGWRMNTHYEYTLRFLDWGREAAVTVRLASGNESAAMASRAGEAASVAASAWASAASAQGRK